MTNDEWRKTKMPNVKAVTVIAAIALGAARLVAEQAPSTSGWPPAGVYLGRDVDTLPKMVHQVKSTYTPEAIRARVEGIVRLSCVVLADGTVGDVRVVKSLGYGLDESATAALKQWQFSPAVKNGVAVPIAVDIQMAFTLRDAPRALTWPEGFDAAPTAGAEANDWREETADASGVRIAVRYPQAWTLRKNPDERSVLTLKRNNTFSTLAVWRPRPVSYSLDRPLSPAELEQIAQVESNQVPREMGWETLGFGQAPAASHIWAWHAYKTSTAVTPSMDATVAPVAGELFESVRVWTFEATANGQAIVVMCMAVVPREASDAGKKTFVAEQAAAFGDIIRHISIAKLP
jgi:TonB family protein